MHATNPTDALHAHRQKRETDTPRAMHAMNPRDSLRALVQKPKNACVGATRNESHKQ
jgi:hypothetical protein